MIAPLPPPDGHKCDPICPRCIERNRERPPVSLTGLMETIARRSTAQPPTSGQQNNHKKKHNHA